MRSRAMGNASYAFENTTVAVRSGMVGTAVPERRGNMRLIDALSESQWDYFINCIYDCCNALGAPDNINANCLIDCLSYMEIDAIPAPNYRVPSTEEWMERYCTKKRFAGYQKQQEDKHEQTD